MTLYLQISISWTLVHLFFPVLALGGSRVFYLDEYTPEVLIPINSKSNEIYKDYWIKSPKKGPGNAVSRFKISLRLHSYWYYQEDGIEILVSRRWNETSPWINATWTENNYTEAADSSEIYFWANGNWTESDVVLMATAYFEENSTASCGDGYFKCEGTDCGRLPEGDGDDEELFRCLPSTLYCNNRHNCGPKCYSRGDDYCYYDWEYQPCRVSGAWVVWVVAAAGVALILGSSSCWISYCFCNKGKDKVVQHMEVA